jgi:CheY-like chemotaxis protein
MCDDLKNLFSALNFAALKLSTDGTLVILGDAPLWFEQFFPSFKQGDAKKPTENEFVQASNSLKAGPYIRLEVNDTGCGMTPEVRDRIFDPFFTTKEKGRGTGMGLSLVHGIVQSCKGELVVHSKPGVGTEFQIFLPAFTKLSEHQTALRGPLLTGDERILFVDDEPAAAELAIKRLNRLGYEVVALTDSVEALNLFSAYPQNFDLIITDLTMPKMSGKVLSKNLLIIRPEIPIIMCSGYSDAISKEYAKKLGIKAYLMKPIAIEELSKTIRTILDS